MKTTPKLIDGLLFYGTDTGLLYAMDLATDTKPATWRRDNVRLPGGHESPIVCQPAVTAKTIYITSLDKHLYAADRKSGEILWRYDSGAPVRTSPVVRDRVVYVINDKGRMIALDEID